MVYTVQNLGFMIKVVKKMGDIFYIASPTLQKIGDIQRNASKRFDVGHNKTS